MVGRLPKKTNNPRVNLIFWNVLEGSLTHLSVALFFVQALVTLKGASINL